MDNHWSEDDIGNLSGKVIIITGSSSGIGRYTAQVLAAHDAHVVLAVRNLAKGSALVGETKDKFPHCNMVAEYLDLTDLKTVKSFSEKIKSSYDKIDILINNAGIMIPNQEETTTKDGFEIHFGTNHLGHFALTGRLLSLIKKSEHGRVVVVSSIAHKRANLDLIDLNWKNRKYDKYKAYCDSKIANLHFAYHLADQLSDEGSHVIVTLAHPGWTKTNITRGSKFLNFLSHSFAQNITKGSQAILRAALDKNAKSKDYYGPGNFFEMYGEPVKVKSHPNARQFVVSKLLWKQSEKLTGAPFDFI